MHPALILMIAIPCHITAVYLATILRHDDPLRMAQRARSQP